MNILLYLLLIALSLFKDPFFGVVEVVIAKILQPNANPAVGLALSGAGIVDRHRRSLISFSGPFIDHCRFINHLIEVIDDTCETVLMFIGVGVDPAVGQVCEALSRARQLFKMFTCALGLNERRAQAVAKLDQPGSVD